MSKAVGIISLGHGSGAGFQLLKKSTDGTDAIFSSGSDRNSYFNANPDDLAIADGNQYKIIRIDSSPVKYQQRQSGSWVNVTSLVQGPTGTAANLANLSNNAIPIKGASETVFEDSGIVLESDTFKTTKNIECNELITALNSFKLADQHTISSGGENVYFTNNSANVHFFPTWQGVSAYDWNSESNTLYRATERVYSDEITQFTLGTENASGTPIPLEGNRTTTSNISYYGIRFRTKEDYSGTLRYESIDVASGVTIYEVFADVNVVDGDMVEIRFSDVDGANAPLELKSGLTLSRKVLKEDGSAILTTPSSVGGGANYIEFPFRSFQDKRLALLSDIGYVNPTISGFFIQSQHTQVDAGTTISGSKLFRYNVITPENIDGFLTLLQDGVSLQTGIDPTGTSVTVDINDVDIPENGSTVFELFGTDTNGNRVNRHFTIRARIQAEALYYGVANTNVAADIDQTSLREVDIVAGSSFNAVFDVPNNSYAVILSPADREIVEITNTLVNTGNILEDFPKVDNAKTIDGHQYDIYTHRNLAGVQGELHLNIRSS